MSRLPLCAAAAQIWAVEELVGQRRQREGLSALGRSMAWPRLARSAQPRSAGAERLRRTGQAED
ncbi:MAG TPA: hypothetical protein VK895_01175 [Jiangellaceae bacterium]|nr:hypothetical protein [Jiangellaceae bacterium]